MRYGFMRNLNIISRCATLYRDEQLADCGLTGCQTPYLPELCTNPGITQDQLAGKLHVNRSSVTRQLALLEEAGFILRKKSEKDSRAIEVYPTHKMQGVLPRVQGVFQTWRQKLTADLTPQELLTLETLLDKLALKAETLA